MSVSSVQGTSISGITAAKSSSVVNALCDVASCWFAVPVLQQLQLVSGVRRSTATRAKDSRPVAVAFSDVAALQQRDGGVAEQH